MLCFLTRVAIKALAVFVFCMPAFAQVNTASIRGNVTDPVGANIAGAQVKLLNLMTSAERVVEADGNGTFNFQFVPVGTYRITISAPGFTTSVQENLSLVAAQSLDLNTQLKVATASESVVVSIEAAQIETSQAALTTTVDSVAVNQLPVQHEDWTTLLQLTAGATKPFTSSTTSSSIPAGSGINLNGLPSAGYNLTVDGTNATSNPEFTSFNFYQAPNIINTINNDAIQEVSNVKGIAPATVGGTMSGNINLITRGGSNQLHGSLYENNESSLFDARNQFLTARPHLAFNEYGGSAGGKILTDKLFFFASYEGARMGAYKAITGTVPSNYLRSIAPAVYSSLLAMIPVQTSTPSSATATTASYSGAGSTFQKDGNGVVRIDENISPSNLLELRYTRGRPYLLSPALLPSNSRTTEGHTDVVNGNYTHIGSRWTENTRAAFNNLLLNRVDADYKSQLPSLSYGFSTGGATLFLVSGNFSTVEEQIAYTRGNHTIQFGGIWQRQNAGRTRVTTQSFSYSTLAGFLADTPTTIQLNLYALPTGTKGFGLTDKQYGLYLQDDWKIFQRLTLNLGIRYDIFTVPQEYEGRIYNRGIDSSNPSLGPGYGAYRASNSMYGSDDNNVQPRVGFAWDPYGKGQTIVRGGFGVLVSPHTIYGGPVTTEQVNAQTPFNISLTASQVKASGLAFPIDGNQYSSILSNLETAGTISSNLPNNTVNGNFPDPYSMQWTVGVEQQLPKSTALEINYVGTRGLKMNFYETQNLPNRLTDISPKSNYGTFYYFTPGDSSYYHGLQVTASKRMSYGFQLSGAYTFSKVISYGDADILQQLQPQDSSNIKAEKGPAPFDVHHRFVMHGIWNLPIDRVHSLHPILSGWQLSGVFSLQTGLPVNITDSSSSYPADRPDRATGSFYQSGYRTFGTGRSHQYLSTSAFTQIAKATTATSLTGTASGADVRAGDLGRYSARAPGVENVDMSLAKSFDFGGRYKFKLRMDTFNTLNHTNLSGLVTTINTSNFGQLTSATPRTMQIAGRLTF
ncbi:carboxypeptidase regulatory-like domain-containing protein [Telmatobacter bradus]|uniref:TonB-dependent receptor n=1 Tax=Telmatobacter bradus TaxID=474953 RepID=UPI003B431675